MRWRSRCVLQLLSLMVLVTLHSCDFHRAERWTVPVEAEDLRNPIPVAQESIGWGAVIYATRCAVCHGDKGKGDGPSSLSLWTPPTDLTDLKVLDQTDGVLFWKITVGRGPMPNWDLILKKEDRWHVINYLRAIAVQ